MTPPTIFTRPKRQIASALSSAFDEVPVKTYSQLLQAITSIATRGASGPLAAMGGSICIIQPFSDWSSAVVIPEECAGLTIRAISRFPLRAAAPATAAMFDVRAEFVTIKDLFCYGDVDGYFTTFVTTGASFSTGRAVDNLRILNNDVFADRVFVDASLGKCDNAKIVGNWQNEANGSHSAAIFVDSTDVLVSGNDLEDGGADSITIGANGARARISDNYTGGGDITTTASGGFNAVSGNVLNGGTYTGAGTDAAAANP